ncbi:MAG: methyltransferase domain-containing protein [bacterium]
MFSHPHKNTDQLGLMPGMKVADLGAGVGAYAIPVAQAVGEKGRVYAVEVQQELVAKIKANVEHARLKNVEYLWGNIEQRGGTHIGDELVDFVIVANVLFQAVDKAGLVVEVRRILKKGGKAVVIDWKESFGGIGPAVQEVVNESKAKELFTQHGFQHLRGISAGDHHYGLIFTKI